MGAVDEFNADTVRVYENCVSPIFIFAMEMDDRHREETQRNIMLLRRVLDHYESVIDRQEILQLLPLRLCQCH